MGPKGLPIKSNKSKLKVYKNSFSGKELVDWLKNNAKVKDKAIAQGIGKEFIKCGYLKCVSDDEQGIKDDSFYRFEAVSMDNNKRIRSTSSKVVERNISSNSLSSSQSPAKSREKKLALSPQRTDSTGSLLSPKTRSQLLSNSDSIGDSEAKPNE